MNRISEMTAVGSVWATQNGSALQSRPAANTGLGSDDIAPTQQPAAVEAVESARHKHEASETSDAFVEQSSQLLAEKLNESANHQDLQFSVDKDSGSTVITVTSRLTGEVVRQIPNEEVLHLMRDVRQQSPVDIEAARIFDQSA